MAPEHETNGAHGIPNVEVWTHTGRKVRFYDDLVRDRVVTLNVFFTSCGDTCPLVTQNLRQVQDLLGDRVGRDIFMYSITLQPELETPEILKDYAELHEVGPGWLFLTGPSDGIGRLRRRLGFAGPDPELDVLAGRSYRHPALRQRAVKPLGELPGPVAA
jgi:protein SCO1/2